VTTTPPSPDDVPSVPDDVWEQFVRDTEASIRASAPKEPSARARMVTERLRQQDAEAARRAKRRPRGNQPSAPPEGWRTGPAAYEAEERGRVRRRWVGLVAAVLVAAVVALFALDPNAVLGWIRGEASAPSSSGAAPSPSTLVPSVSATLPSDAPSSLPSLLARPVITSKKAFPDAVAHATAKDAYQKVDVATTGDCGRGMSQELATIIEQGKGCLQLMSALYIDPADRAQITVTVLSFRRAEDAGAVFAMASQDPAAYQVVSLDPPAASGHPTVPPGSPGVFDRLMTVRSVVFANGQWTDGRNEDVSELTRRNGDLLRYVVGNVVAYEDPRS
jgi:hypothetical protein